MNSKPNNGRLDDDLGIELRFYWHPKTKKTSLSRTLPKKRKKPFIFYRLALNSPVRPAETRLQSFDDAQRIHNGFSKNESKCTG